MPAPGEHKTVQPRILKYAQEIGWTYVPRAEAERRRGFDPAGATPEERARKAYLMTKPIKVEHLKPCADWWGGAQRQGRVESEVASRVTAEDVKARGYNLDFKNPHNCSRTPRWSPTPVSSRNSVLAANDESTAKRVTLYRHCPIRKESR